MKRVGFSFLFVIIFSSLLAFAQSNTHCDGLSLSTNLKFQKKLSQIEVAQNEGRVGSFFVGLWSKANSFDKKRLSASFKKDDQALVAGIVQVQFDVSARLKVDRQKFSVWVQQNSLQNDIEISNAPEDGSFLLFKANTFGISRVLCAAAKSQLPSVLFYDLGY